MNTESSHTPCSRNQDEAAIWFARLQDPDSPSRLWKPWVKWYAVPENRRAFEALLDLWEAAGRLPPSAMPAASNPGADRADAASVPAEAAAAPRSVRTPRRVSWVAAAAGLVAACFVLGIALSLSQLRASTIEAAGEWRYHALSDGTVVSIGPDTPLTVRMERQQRLVHLARGEAIFSVATDPARPFIVNTDLVTARAVGTSFAVSRLDGRSLVTVGEGVVEVARKDDASTGVAVPLHANQQASLSQGLPIEVRDVDAREVMRRAGNRMIFFVGVEAAGLVADFNRRNVTQIRIVDDAISTLRLSGQFDIAYPDIFAKYLSFYGRVDLVKENGVTVRLDRDRREDSRIKASPP